MVVYKVVNSYLGENTYIVSINENCMLIDPGSDTEVIDDYIVKGKFNVRGILITHYHDDHVFSLDYFRSKYKCEVFDYKFCGEVSVSGFNFFVKNTYGHTDDSVCFYFKEDNIMFTGDFLFKGSIGRYDFINSSYSEMVKSIKWVKSMSKSIVIYPGHGDESSLEAEFNNNYYLI
ncbi:MAG: MBL fold metallo-hydrolase [Bacilli bacterium]